METPWNQLLSFLWPGAHSVSVHAAHYQRQWCLCPAGLCEERLGCHKAAEAQLGPAAAPREKGISKRVKQGQQCEEWPCSRSGQEGLPVALLGHSAGRAVCAGPVLEQLSSLQPDEVWFLLTSDQFYYCKSTCTLPFLACFPDTADWFERSAGREAFLYVSHSAPRPRDSVAIICRILELQQP